MEVLNLVSLEKSGATVPDDVEMSVFFGVSLPGTPRVPLSRSAKKTVFDNPSEKSFCLYPLPIVKAPLPRDKS